MTHDLFDQALAYHRALPDRIRVYLSDRGIPDAVIDTHLLGWTGRWISIPIPDQEGSIASFKLRRDPDDSSEGPKMYATPGARAQLYGWDRVLSKPEGIVICEGEFDRLVLEARGFAAVTSTAGARTFLPEWAECFAAIPNVFLCFDNDEAGRSGAVHVATLIPHARAITWPAGTGEGCDVTDFFTALGRGTEDFAALLREAQPLRPLPPPSRNRAPSRGTSPEVAQAKASVALEEIIGRYVILTVSGENYIALCPFHEDHKPSFVVFPKTRQFHCFGCGAHGDVLTFLMKVEGLTFPEALAVIRQLS
jgi:DNA primase